MLVGDMIIKVQNSFGDTSEAQISKLEIIDWLNEAQRRISQDTGWIGDHVETGVVAGQRAYDLPPDIQMMERLELDGRKLPRVTLQQIDNENPVHTVEEGHPNKYYVWGNKLYLYPTPQISGSGNLDLWYKRTPTILTSESDTPELPENMQDAMIRFALGRAKEKDEEYRDANVILGGVEIDISRQVNETTEKAQETYPVITPAIDDEGMWY